MGMKVMVIFNPERGEGASAGSVLGERRKPPLLRNPKPLPVRSMDQPMRQLSLFLAILLIPGIAEAHDFWIEPSTFHPAAGTTVSAALR